MTLDSLLGNRETEIHGYWWLNANPKFGGFPILVLAR